MIPKHDLESAYDSCSLEFRNKSHLLVHVQFAENFGRIQQVLVVIDPCFRVSLRRFATQRGSNILLGVEQHEGQVQHNSEPVPVDHKEEGQECVDSGFGDDVGVETVAKVDGVDVIAEKK